MAKEQAPTTGSGVDREELDEFLASAPEGLRSWAEAQRSSLQEGAEADATEPKPKTAAKRRQKTEKTSTARGINKVLVALLAAAVVLLVQQWGQPDEPAAVAPHGDLSGTGGLEGPAGGFEALDEERVEELEAELESDPDDIDAKRELATLHNDAGLWNEAAEYHEQVLEQVPADVDSLLALGVIQFNLGDVDAAEDTWQGAVEADPSLPEPYFNLGFAYLSKEPADNAKANEMWQKLIDVAPESELAKTAQSHLDAIAEEG